MRETPTCTKDAPYRGTHTSYHPDSGPLDVIYGYVIWGCPNCGRRIDTGMTEAEVYREIGFDLLDATP